MARLQGTFSELPRGVWVDWPLYDVVLILAKSADDYFVCVFYEHEVRRGQEEWTAKYPTSKIDVSQFEERSVQQASSLAKISLT